MKKMIHISKVVSRNFIIDLVTIIQNFFGANLSGYEKMIKRANKQIMDEIKSQKLKLSWYRMEITQLTNGAMAVMLYGEKQ